MNYEAHPHLNLLRQQLSIDDISSRSIGNLIKDSSSCFQRIFETEQPTGSSSKICRICHGGESYENLVGPCMCKGSIALAHLSCLERWLMEADKSTCELCLHHFEVQRKPKYGILKSVFKWLCNPGHHASTLIEDFISFCLYTPATFTSCCILMMLCENIIPDTGIDFANRTSTELVAFCALAGVAAIDFTYSYWLISRLHIHLLAWRAWYRENSCLTIILPPRKLSPRPPDLELDEVEVE
ncbi:uncharacterized protein CBL_00192 [Carabus blaptoides fortunei]